jgi:hypothetical protein
MHFCNARRLAGLLLLTATLFCCGCGAKFTAVTGKVSLGGKPLEMGTISFFPAGAKMGRSCPLPPRSVYRDLLVLAAMLAGPVAARRRSVTR